MEEVRDIDRGERIGAFHNQNVAGLQGAEGLAGPERRQRAFEAAQVEGLFGHSLSSSAQADDPVAMEVRDLYCGFAIYWMPRRRGA
jgi:hypothetical protein